VKECNQCGKCCIHYGDGGLSASKEEIALWEIFRPDIYRYVRGDKIWMDPTSGQQLSRCPWLEKVPNEAKYTCGIYHERPEDCRHYPTSIQEMVKDECEMIEVKDLTHPKQAQNTLDIMMRDSRPPLLKN